MCVCCVGPFKRWQEPPLRSCRATYNTAANLALPRGHNDDDYDVDDDDSDDDAKNVDTDNDHDSGLGDIVL